MNAHVIVIGGGFTGAAAASALTEAGVTVTLLEARPILGGRTSSLKDGVTKEDVDNGQHLFLGCYRETRRFLRRLKVEDRLTFLPALSVPFVSPGGRRAELSCPSLPFSWGLLTGLMGFSELSLGDKWSVLRGAAAMRLRRRDLTGLTVSRWLDILRQSPGARRAFWTPLCLATLNEKPEVAAAEALRIVLREGFFGRAQDRSLGYASVSLSKLWAVELAAYLKRQGGLAAPKQSVTSLRAQDGLVRKILMEGGEEVEADAVISAVPLSSFLKICPPEIRGSYARLEAVTHSAIASVNLWFRQPPFEEPFVGLLDTEVQWAFNRARIWGRGASPGYVSLVISGAASHARKTSEEIIDMAVKDLRRCFPSFRENPVHATVMWEREATPSPSPAHWKLRPPAVTSLKNFIIAGDWVDSGLPATIEAACRSGHRAAALAKDYLDKRSRFEVPAC